jgi:phytoene dehydrogenase-like protein
MQASLFLGNDMTKEADAIVVGSGINGLVAAAELAQAGWSVILVERNAKIGGFIATEERTLPGYLHDTFSSWHPMFVTGPAYAALGEMLHRHGLEYRNTESWLTASVADDGRVTLAHRDPERTVAEFAHPEDRSAYSTMLQRLGENMESIGGLLGDEMRSLALVRHISDLIQSSGCAAPNGGCAPRLPAAGPMRAGTSADTRLTICTHRGCCMPGFLQITPLVV